MSSTDHERASELFLTVRKLPASERTTFLERECSGDALLRSEVESLLGHDEEQSDFLQTPALGNGFDLADPDMAQTSRRGKSGAGPQAAMPERIASYRILGVLGEGGMGVVYSAEQDKPRRRVALKVLKTGMTTPAMLRRFEVEAQILGRLQHPGIAQIYEAGIADEGAGRSAYFAMEYIRGRSLCEHADAQRFDTRDRLRLIVRVCEAVQFAHLKGVIHRDLKPANILVNQSGQPKILDFGVARATDADVQATAAVTDVGQLVGTLPYMSPEQVAGDPSELDTRSDVYALGVLAYELLAGRPPYDLDKTSIHEAVRMIQEKEPVPLGSVKRALRGDVETIVAKALEKDKQRRYQSASDLRADILHHLSDEPIIARPASRIYQFGKFARRNKGLVGGVAASFFMLVAGVVVATTLALSEIEQRQLAETKSEEARLNAELARVSARREAEQRQLAETRTEEARLSAELARTNEQKAQAVSAYLRELFHGAMNPLDAGHEVAMSDVIDRAVETIGTRFANQPAVEADLRNEFGAIYHTLGLTERAEPQYLKALALRRLHLGDDHEDTLDSVNNLGQLRLRQGRFAEAETLLLEALKGRRDLLGGDHVKTLVSKMNLGRVVQGLGRADDAEKMLRETLESQLRALGEDHNDTLTTMANLSALIRRRGEFTEAGRLALRSYEGLKRVHGPDYHTTLLALGGVAKNFRDRKEFDRAEPLYREQIAGLQRTVGEEHRDTLFATANLATTLRMCDKLDEAETLYERAYRGCRHTLGDANRSTLRVGEMLADVLRDRGKWPQAEYVMRDIAEIYRRLHGDQHVETLAALERVVHSMSMQRKYAEAETLQREVIDGRRGTLGPSDPAVLESTRYLIGLIRKQNELEKAERLAAELVEQAAAVLDDDDWRLARFHEEYGIVLDRMGKHDLAEQSFVAAYERCAQTRGERDRRTVDAIQRLIRFYESRDKPELVAQFTARLRSAISDGDSGDP